MNFRSLTMDLPCLWHELWTKKVSGVNETHEGSEKIVLLVSGGQKEHICHPGNMSK